MSAAASAMGREMAEQPEVLQRMLDRADAVRSLARSVSRSRVEACVLVARGSSANAAVAGRYVLEIATGRPAGLAAPSVQTLYHSRIDYRGVLVVGISQSGVTSDVIEAVTAMRAKGAAVLAVTNEPASPLAGAAHVTIDLAAGPEIAVPATKTVVATLLALVLLSEGLADRTLVDRRQLDRLPEAVEAILSDQAPADTVSAQLIVVPHLVAVARGLLVSGARETALKLRETTGIPAEAWSAAEFRHGPIAATRPRSMALSIRTAGDAGEDVRRLETELEARGGRVVRINDEEEADLPLPAALPEALATIPAVVRGQQLARSMSLARGIDPDEPLGLAKVTRV